MDSDSWSALWFFIFLSILSIGITNCAGKDIEADAKIEMATLECKK